MFFECSVDWEVNDFDPFDFSPSGHVCAAVRFSFF